MRNNVFVVDTNVLISAALSPFSTNAEVLDKALRIGKVVYSASTWQEFMEVLFRKKFDKYFSLDSRKEIADHFIARFEKRFVTEVIQVCRDPKDDMLLELALSAKASAIVTGDDDLIVLNPFEGIPILNPADFISMSFV